ncbi:hypothetical protein ABBQ38_000116 [Trebouxia sp. C0009 RCD-2024]
MILSQSGAGIGNRWLLFRPPGVGQRIRFAPARRYRNLRSVTVFGVPEQSAGLLFKGGASGDVGSFSAPVDDEDILHIGSLRDKLKVRDSPFVATNNSGGGFVGDKDLLFMRTTRYESEESSGSSCWNGLQMADGTCMPLPLWAIRSGPRRQIYFDPKEVTAAVVTCGGLCPGLNDVIQNIVFTLEDYGVPPDQIFGIKYGLRGFYDKDFKPINLNKQIVQNIHLQGGTMLGTSRGGADLKEIVRKIDLWGLTHLYVVGGNGGNAAANAINTELQSAGVVCSVIGVPKSIDNDILLIDKCFGFESAVEEAQRALLAGYVEAASARCGLGLIKLMGRQSGYIAMQASMASGVVDVCLIPEVKFELEALTAYVRQVIRRKGYCVVCIAEGAGQEIMQHGHAGRDKSGNPILSDIGTHLRDLFKDSMKGVDVKYIDPTYMIRAIPTTTNDRIYCKVLGQGAVHGAFAGFTGCTVGLINTHYVYLPIPIIIQAARTVDPKGRSWNRLRTAINQPDFVTDPATYEGPTSSQVVSEADYGRRQTASVTG